MKGRCLQLIVLSIVLLACVTVNEANSHKLVKRQFPSRGGVPLSRSRQFPPPEELEESEEDEYSSSDEAEEKRSSPPAFRGRQPPPEEEEYDYTYTEAPKVTTPAPQKTTARVSVFNSNRFAVRPRFGAASSSTTSRSPRVTPATTAASPRFRATPAQSQRLDVVASVLNKPPPPRSRSIATARTGNENNKPENVPEVASRRTSNSTRVQSRGRLRLRSTTTTTTTTQPPPSEEYYYYYEDDEVAAAPKNQPIATTTSTTTTTTTPRPRTSFNRPRPPSSRSRTTPKPVVKFDPESQFAPPPDDVVEVAQASSSTKRFTTSSTMSPEDSGGIPPHLRNRYRPRTDGRFIDFLRDPNRPRELKGFDLTDYPFYIVVPDDIDFDCDDKKDGYYASVPHRCQLFHYCFASQRFDFLCANYTLYDQTTFTCRFANHVDCESSAKFYFRNDELWKETTTTTTTTTRAPRRRRPQREEDYDDDYYEDDYEDEEEDRRRRPPKRRRNNNRRKNRRKQQRDEEEKDDEETKEKKKK